ncbi:MFS transporter [Chloroflexota bacterium]
MPGQRDTAFRERVSSHVAAGGIVASHTFQHFYRQGFFVILPVLYTSLGLTPIAAGLIGTIRQVSGGAASMLGGVLIDQRQHWRTLILYLSLIVMGLGYLLVGVAPTYFLVLLSLGLAGAAGSLWHPAAISLISQRYPGRRGFMLALHRSTGSAGDILGSIMVGALLLVLGWRYILFGAFPAAIIVAFMLWVVLRQASGRQKLTSAPTTNRMLREQFGTLKEVLKSRELILLILVSGISGLGQGSLMLWLPLYLQETQGMGSLGIGMHLGLLSGVGIASGPFLGILSDRLGRKLVIFMVLVANVVLAVLMALIGSGVILTILVGFMGAFLFALNPLVQAGALDIAEGKKLEGSMIGLLWGSNHAFTGLSPVLVGFLISFLGYGILFWYVAAMSAVAGIIVFALLFIAPQTHTVVKN